MLYFPQPPTDVDSLDPHLKQIHLLYTYAMSLSRYDLSYDLRDRARLLKNVYISPFGEAALHTHKPVPRMESLGERGAEWMLGSMAQIIGQNATGDMTLPEWGSEIPEKGVRDIPEHAVQGVNVASVAPIVPVAPEKGEKRREKKVWKDLDKFYASESEDEEEEDDDDDDDDEDEEEAEEEESEGEEDGSDAEESDDETEDDSEDETKKEREPLTSGWG
jgi:AP-3 complex subunit beta